MRARRTTQEKNKRNSERNVDFLLFTSKFPISSFKKVNIMGISISSWVPYRLYG